MKNALLLLLSVVIIGLTTSFIVWNLREGKPGEETKTIASEAAVTTTDFAGAAGDEARTAPAVTDTVTEEPVVASNEAEAHSKTVAVETVSDDEVGEDPAFHTWKTLEGRTFEAKLIWVSKSGKSIRFEEPDGSTFVYSTEFLEAEYHDAVRSMVIAKNASNGQVF